MPIPSKDPKQAFDELVKRREAELELQKQKQIEANALAKDRHADEERAYLADEAETRARGVEREQWRQDQHAERLSDEERVRQKEAAKLVEEERKKKEAEAKRKRDEQMEELHARAIAKRSTEKIESARTEEEKRKRDVSFYEERQLSQMNADMMRGVEHLERERDVRKRALQAAADHTRAEAEEMYKDAKIAAERRAAEEMRSAETDAEKRDVRMRESQEVNRANAERRRALFALDETLQQKLFDMDTETKRLIEEVKHDADGKKVIAERDAERKKTEAEAQRASVEKLFDLGEPKKDSKDPLA